MSLCGNANLTLIVKVLQMKGIIDIEGDRITGQFGKYLDDNIENFDHSKRYCRLVPAFEFGQQLPTGNWTGVLGLLKEKKGDLFLQPGTQFFITDFMEHTATCLTDRYTIAHQIENEKKLAETDIVNLIMNFEISVKIFSIIFSAIFLIILILISFLSTSKFNVAKLVANFFQFKLDFIHPFTKIGLSLIFYHLFFMIFKLLISNQISTSKVLVDTSNIINSAERLLEADLVVCFLKNDVEIRMAEMSPKNSFMRKIYENKIYPTPQKDMEGELSKHCLLSMKTIGQQIDSKNKVLFINEASLYGFIQAFVAPNPNVVYWIDHRPLLETISVYYRRKGLSYYQKLISDRSNMLKLESGIAKKAQDRVIEESKKIIAESSKFYNYIEDYVTDNTLFTDLKLSYLERFTIIFLFSNIVFVFIFLFLQFKKFIRITFRRYDYKRNYTFGNDARLMKRWAIQTSGNFYRR